jgi:hypothetical protein
MTHLKDSKPCAEIRNPDSFAIASRFQKSCRFPGPELALQATGREGFARRGSILTQIWSNDHENVVLVF